jgi:hypothetical protein
MGEVVKMYQGKAVQLNILERMGLLAILPKEGTFQNLKTLRLFREALSFGEEENKKLQWMQQGNMLTWNPFALKNKETGEYVVAPAPILKQMLDKDPDKFETEPSCPDKEVKVSGTIEGIIVKALTDLDKAGKLTEDQYSLYEKFMEGNEDEGAKSPKE